MFCRHCGKEINDNAYICVGCGCKVERPEEKPAQPSFFDNYKLVAILSLVCSAVGFIIFAFASWIVGYIFIILAMLSGNPIQKAWKNAGGKKTIKYSAFRKQFAQTSADHQLLHISNIVCSIILILSIILIFLVI